MSLVIEGQSHFSVFALSLYHNPDFRHIPALIPTLKLTWLGILIKCNVQLVE